MDGLLDDQNLAWFTLDLGQGPLDFLIDTGFKGTLIVGEDLFDTAAGTWAGEMEADLAADHTASYQLYFVEINWLGEHALVEILVGPGTECLLGVDLLAPNLLEIDYALRIVRLVTKDSS